MKNLLRLLFFGLLILSVSGCSITKEEWNLGMGLVPGGTITILPSTNSTYDFIVEIMNEQPDPDEKYLEALFKQSCPNYEVVKKQGATFKVKTVRDFDLWRYRFYFIKCGPGGTALE